MAPIFSIAGRVWAALGTEKVTECANYGELRTLYKTVKEGEDAKAVVKREEAAQEAFVEEFGPELAEILSTLESAISRVVPDCNLVLVRAKALELALALTTPMVAAA